MTLAVLIAVISQIVGTVIYLIREEGKRKALAEDLASTKRRHEKDIEALEIKIQKTQEVVAQFMKEEVNKLEAQDKSLLERMGRYESQILTILSELGIKVGKIEGMLTNTFPLRQ